MRSLTTSLARLARLPHRASLLGATSLIALFAAGCPVNTGTKSAGDLGLQPTDGSSHPGDGFSPGGDMSSPDCDVSNRLCAHQFSWKFTGGNVQPDVVEVRGTFNNWTPGALPMTMANGTWVASAPLPFGSTVEYKFWAKWADNPNNPLWLTDPSNPDTAMDGNSRLQNLSCTSWTCKPGMPSLSLVATPTTTPNSYSFQVKFIPGGAGAMFELDPNGMNISLNGAAATVPYDAGTHLFSVSVNNGVQSPNKYGYVFRVKDLMGNSASLYVPFWIEPSPFEWRDSFMYEVMIDRFLAGGTSKAGPSGPPTDPAGDWKGGDFGGVTQKINDGYFTSMGVNTLWISSPVLSTKLCEMGTGGNAGHCLSGYHSYFPIATGWVAGSESDALFTGNGITNPIDPHFGTADDLKALINAAHAKGMRVLTDLVVNHVFSDAAPPSAQMPQRAPLFIAHNNDAAWFNIPYDVKVNDCGAENLWDAPTSQMWNRTNCWFNPFLPDFNTQSQVVEDAVNNHAVWLMEEFNLDGFRVDATKQVMNNICVDLRSKVSAAIATGLPFYMVGEALGSNVDNVMDCVGADRLDGSMNDPMHYAMVATFLQGGENPNSFDGDLQFDESTWTGRYPKALMGHFFGSHDVARAISLAANNVGDPWNSPPPAHESNPTAFKRLAMAQAFLLTYDSLPILWQGDEFGMPGSYDPDNRRLMRFDAALSANEQAALAGFQKLGAARAAHSALRRGNRTRLWVDGTFYAYGRVDGSDVVVAAFNFDANNPATRTIPVNNIGLNGMLKEALTGSTATAANGNLTITVAPLGAAVYTK